MTTVFQKHPDGLADYCGAYVEGAGRTIVRLYAWMARSAESGLYCGLRRPFIHTGTPGEHREITATSVVGQFEF